MIAKAILYIYEHKGEERYFVQYYLETDYGKQAYPIRGSGSTGNKEYSSKRLALAAIARYANKMRDEGVKWGGRKIIRRGKVEWGI